MKLCTRRSLTSLTYIYMAIIYILLATKLKPKAKQHLAHKLIFQFSRKRKIHKRFGMILRFSLEKMLFLINLTFVIKIKQAQNQ